VSAGQVVSGRIRFSSVDANPRDIRVVIDHSLVAQEGGREDGGGGGVEGGEGGGGGQGGVLTSQQWTLRTELRQ
jgi:hypothetical protein